MDVDEMNQDIDSKIWERKDLRQARMAGFKNATLFVTACIQTEVFKPKDLEDGFEEVKKFYQYIVDEIYNGMQKQTTSTSDQPSSEAGNNEPRPATDKQKALLDKWGMEYDENLTLTEASHLIDEHIKQQKGGSP